MGGGGGGGGGRGGELNCGSQKYKQIQLSWDSLSQPSIFLSLPYMVVVL